MGVAPKMDAGDNIEEWISELENFHKIIAKIVFLVAIKDYFLIHNENLNIFNFVCICNSIYQYIIFIEYNISFET